MISDIARNAKAITKATAETGLSIIAPYSLISKDTRKEVLQSITDEYAIPKSSIMDVLPCTPLQEGLITLTVKDPEAYVLREIYRLPSKLDIGRFKESWEVVVRDASVLRTRIVNLESHGCFQVVMGQGIYWQSARSVKEYIDKDKDHPFKYGVPLANFAIIETTYNGTYFIWTVHHSLYDGWSKNLILKKVEEAYRYPLSLSLSFLSIA
jgi:hypothetical protein